MTVETRSRKKPPGRLITLLDLGPVEVVEELSKLMELCGEKPYRVKQILRQVYQRRVLDFQEMTDLPKGLRESLAERYRILPLETVERKASQDGTVKTLWRLLDDSTHVESVTILMERSRYTVCLSTQTGCALGCSFCATGRLGPGRNLTAGEIVGQALALTRSAEEQGITGSRDEEERDKKDLPRAPNLVFMGMGEPFLNYENLKKALYILNHNDLMQVGARRITVSTVGLPDRIVRFSRDFPQMKLAVSLHSARDGIRRRLMPVARKVSIEQLLEACREAYRLTNRRITFEYLVIPGVNNLPEDIEALARMTAGLPCKINLIPFNPVEGVPFISPIAAELESFRKALLSACKQAVTLRSSHGSDIAGACGQLAAGGVIPSL